MIFCVKEMPVINLIEQGTKVRAMLDAPRDVIQGKRLPGGFREGDVRWGLRERTVMKTLIAPGTVPMYLLDDGKGGIDYRVMYIKINYRSSLQMKRNQTGSYPRKQEKRSPEIWNRENSSQEENQE